jgi:2-polyprenyl-3-methyl-5-hydroxy-6-metoxy-1,4-benzoquinol methylase
MPRWLALLDLGGIDGARVLEIGCGDSRLTFLYALAALSVLAIDPRSTAIGIRSLKSWKKPR